MNGDGSRDEDGKEHPRVGEDDLSARLKRLGDRLEEARDASSAAESGRTEVDGSALGRAFRLSTEFIAGPIVGAGLGWLFDKGLGTSPWGMIVLLMLGFGVMRASGFLEGPRPPGSGGSGP
jgi:ATP synthase protein I